MARVVGIELYDFTTRRKVRHAEIGLSGGIDVEALGTVGGDERAARPSGRPEDR